MCFCLCFLEIMKATIRYQVFWAAAQVRLQLNKFCTVGHIDSMLKHIFCHSYAVGLSKYLMPMATKIFLFEWWSKIPIFGSSWTSPSFVPTTSFRSMDSRCCNHVSHRIIISWYHSCLIKRHWCRILWIQKTRVD